MPNKDPGHVRRALPSDLDFMPAADTKDRKAFSRDLVLEDLPESDCEGSTLISEPRLRSQRIQVINLDDRIRETYKQNNPRATKPLPTTKRRELVW